MRFAGGRAPHDLRPVDVVHGQGSSGIVSSGACAHAPATSVSVALIRNLFTRARQSRRVPDRIAVIAASYLEDVLLQTQIDVNDEHETARHRGRQWARERRW
jgi:hypothetical protein